MFWNKPRLFLVIPVVVFLFAACGTNKKAAEFAITDYVVNDSILTCDCSGYNRMLKNSDYNRKFKCALQFYKNKKYDKALPLFEELTPLKKGTTDGEICAFLYAFCNFHVEDYESASFFFMIFNKSYPFSERAEEAAYMVAYCAYLSSPDYSLDPTNTYRAIQELQLFIDRYPTSTRIPKCNELIDKLRGKLETKDFKVAKQYYKMRQYKSAIAAFKTLLNEYPETEYREECIYLTIKAAYYYAEDSFESKKYERYKIAVDNYLTFKDKYPQSSYLGELTALYELSKDLMIKYKPFKV